MVKVSAPGKLFLSGEWAVLEVGNPGIVAAVNKRVHVEIEEADAISLSIDDFGIRDLKARFDRKLSFGRELSEKEEKGLLFAKASIETALRYLGEYRPFRLRSWGDLSQIEVDGEVRKVGFGSSAASVVAIIAGILALHGKDIEKRETRDLIFKLSAMAHYFAQGKVGSAFDVAASTYGGVFVYKRFDSKWLVKEMESGKSVKGVAEQDWPSWMVESLEIPDGFILDIGWTKESASTSAMVKQLNAWADGGNRDEYERLFSRIAGLVKESIPHWKAKEKDRILENLRRNETLLRELGQRSGVSIETPELRKLSEIADRNGAAGKLSGAGGGDCGIAVSFDRNISEKVRKDWEDNGLLTVDATIDYQGVRRD
jgi:phosphomevalonate kinase